MRVSVARSCNIITNKLLTTQYTNLSHARLTTNSVFTKILNQKYYLFQVYFVVVTFANNTLLETVKDSSVINELDAPTNKLFTRCSRKRNLTKSVFENEN